MYSAASALAAGVAAALAASVAACAKGRRHSAVQENVADIVEQIAHVPGLGDERRQIHRRGLVERPIQCRRDHVGAVRCGLRRINLKLRAEQPARGPVLGRKITEHAGCVEQIFVHLVRVGIQAVGRRDRPIQTADQVRQEQNRLPQMTEADSLQSGSIIAEARLGIGENRGDHRFHIAIRARKHLRHAPHVRCARIAGNQVLDQLLADERRHRRLLHERVD